MYLSKLEIFGFKTFYHKTEVNFTDGLTCIVGPNGCGKTNVVDAIRWALGEQRSSTLRSDKMENVIFNGTKTRKPLGMSEVSLTIQNNKGILPVEYSEVTISRRIFRSGESEYLLNKNVCRLKDITNLFMDTGMAANAYSVIELKMVEDILSNRQDGRRILFEEAAGVNKYKHRRKSTLNKLEAIQADLTRVNDIYSEVQKKVSTLERQSKKAEQYNIMYSELKELEINLAERKLFNYKTKSEESSSEQKRLSEEKSKISANLEALQADQNKLYNELNEVEKNLEAKRAEISDITDKIHNTKELIITHTEKINYLHASIKRQESEILSNLKKSSDLSTAIEESKKEIETLNNKIQEAEHKLGQLVIEKQNIEIVLKSSREEYTEKQAELKEISDLFNAKSNELEKVVFLINNSKDNLFKLEQKSQDENKLIEKSVAYINELMQELYSTQLRIKEAEEELMDALQLKDDLGAQLSKLKDKELEVRSLLNGIDAKIEFIQNLIDNLEGFSKGTKTLLNRTDWHNGEKILVVDAGSVSEKLKIAFDSLLKNYFSHILLENSDDLMKGISLVKENNLGHAAFHFTNHVKKKSGLINYLNKIKIKNIKRKAEKEEGFLGWASDLVECSSKWKKFFEIIIGNVAVVSNLSNAINLKNKYNDIDCLTLEGDYLYSNFVYEIGSQKSVADTAFGRKKVLAELNDIQIKESYNLEQINNKQADIVSRLESIDLKRINEKIKLFTNEQSNLEKQISQAEFQKNKAIDEIAGIDSEIKVIKQSLEENEALLSVLNNQVAEIKNKITDKEAEFNVVNNKLTELDAHYNKLVSEENKEKIKFAELTGQLSNLHNSVERYTSEISSLDAENIRKNEENRDSEKQIAELNNTLTNLNNDLDIAENEKSRLNEELQVYLSEFNRIREILGENEKVLQSLRSEQVSISENLYAQERTILECQIQSDNLVERIQEEYQLKLFDKQFDDNETFDFTENEKRVHELKNRIKSLGAINSLAFAELDEERQRLEFLTKQRDDLIQSEVELLKLMDEINLTAQQLFLETFEKIRINFIDTFRGLFNEGDEADLKLEEGVDPLEAKIEIIAKPKGKRPTTIESLSQGEKTLTAIALLFAIYLVKPSPFCILDEVDAPLDDANIGRFIKIINKFSENTQFIIVTHNKLTMEAADTLYGITMEEEGISKLVAVKFEEENKYVQN